MNHLTARMVGFHNCPIPLAKSFGPQLPNGMTMDTPKTDQAQDSKENEAGAQDAARAKGDPAEGNKKADATKDASKPAVPAKKNADEPASKKGSVNKPQRTPSKRENNNVRKLRMERMMSKAELARRAGLSTLTIDRVEKGMPCRMDTKRKILEALGLTPSDRVAVFGEDD